MYMDGIRIIFWINRFLTFCKNDHSTIFLAYRKQNVHVPSGKRTDYPFKTFSLFASTEWRCLDETICSGFFFVSVVRSFPLLAKETAKVEFHSRTNALVIVRSFFSFFWLEGYS